MTKSYDITWLYNSPHTPISTYTHTHLDIPEAFFKQRQHLRELVVGVYVVGGAAALLQQLDDVLVLDLLVDLELLEGGAERLEERPEIIIVGEVRLRQLWVGEGRGVQKNSVNICVRVNIPLSLHHGAVDSLP